MEEKYSEENKEDTKEESLSIIDYILKTLNIEISDLQVDQKLFCKNFDHAMCHVILDIREIEERIRSYRLSYDQIKNTKGNNEEFERRRIKYFCDINKKAREEICAFLAEGITGFLSEMHYDTLQRESERENLSDLFFRRRYKYAWHRDYYSMDYPYGTVVKVSEYVKEKYHFEEQLKKERELIHLYNNKQDQFWRIMYKYVEHDDVMVNVLRRISTNYHLKRRQEIFETLTDLFLHKKYQSFISLGLLQIEGLFDDYCSIRYGENENQGTLVEKAQRSLETNEYSFLRMYPYFAFDIPLLRNEVAHKGMLSTDNAKNIAYRLVLDLNTLSQMVKSESYDKFIPAIMAHEKLAQWEPGKDGDTDELYDTLLYELLMFDKMANEHFWNIIKDPTDYKDEIEFYRVDDLPDGQIDLPGIVTVMTNLVRSEGLWKAINRLLQQYATPYIQWDDVVDFVKRMKNQYIATLDGPAKTECIEVAKRLERLSKTK